MLHKPRSPQKEKHINNNNPQHSLIMKTKRSILGLITASAIGFGLVGGANAQTPWAIYTNTLTPDLKVTADLSKPGFIWNVFANQNNQINSRERTEAALTGRVTDALGVVLENLADTNAQGVALAVANPLSSSNATARFEIDTMINLNHTGGGGGGSFTPDDQMPGLPATDSSTAGIAAEVLTYLNLPAGLTRMGILSDDVYWVTAGKVYDAFDAIRVGTRVLDETVLYLNVQEAGVYPFRVIYENGGGGGHIEWYTLLPDDTKVLVNDTANGGVAAYRATTTSIPTYVKRVAPEPAPRQVNGTSPSLQIELADGTSTTVADASITLSFDGSPVTPVKARTGSVVTVTYTPTGLRFPDEHHTARLTFTNSAGTAFAKQWPFYGLKNIVLPAPVLTENFDSYAEGDVPTGWTAWNFTGPATSGLDLDNLNSDSYLGWIVVSKARLDLLKGEIALPAAPGQLSNGVPVTMTELVQGNILYAETDARGNVPGQIQFITTKAFNLSSVANPAVSFFALYEQNQDNLNAVEYSVNGGTTWLPVVYYLDQSDRGGDIILMPDGTVDAVSTFIRTNGDIATWTDGVPKGGNYGDGIAAPISQALGRFIAPRNNDDPVFDKRLEIYRLPLASHKSDVRLRLAQIATSSWYFGMDNLSFYDVAAPVRPVLSIARASGNSAALSWTGDGTLLEATAVAGPWTISPSQGNPQTVATAGSKFYRVGP